MSLGRLALLAGVVYSGVVTLIVALVFLIPTPINLLGIAAIGGVVAGPVVHGVLCVLGVIGFFMGSSKLQTLAGVLYNLLFASVCGLLVIGYSAAFTSWS
jgi:hypothetical protein